PADLLAFFICAPLIADAHFINSQAALSYFDGNLWLKSKTVFFNWYRLDHLSAKHFVAGLHVAEIDIGQAIRKQRQEPIADGVPEIKYAVGSAAQKTRAVHHV